MVEGWKTSKFMCLVNFAKTLRPPKVYFWENETINSEWLL